MDNKKDVTKKTSSKNNDPKKLENEIDLHLFDDFGDMEFFESLEYEERFRKGNLSKEQFENLKFVNKMRTENTTNFDV